MTSTCSTQFPPYVLQMYEGRLRQKVFHCELSQLAQPDPPAHRGGAQVFVLRQSVRPAVSA